LKSTLKHELEIDNTQWASVISMVWVVGTVSPFVAGLLIDTMGEPLAGALAITLILLGNGVCAIGVGSKKLSIFLIGRAIYSTGGGAVLLVGEVIMFKWFKGRQLPLAFGFAATISGLMSFSGPAAVTAILSKNGNITIPFWLATGLSAFGLLCFGAYALIHYSHYSRDRGWMKTRRLIDGLAALPGPYWQVLLCISVQGTLFIPLHEVVPEMMETEWGYTRVESSRLFVYLHIIPIVLHFSIGIFINRIGRRLNMFLAGSLMVFLASMFITFVRKVPIMVSLIMMNFSGSMVPASIFSLMNLVIDNHEVAGAALGLIRSAEFASVTIMEMLNGILQDSDHNRYDTVLLSLAAFAGILLAVAISVLAID
ncbi:major facilitator superfamily domain-containing protein, partial [Kickxella alabastrina]|uniref:major facilitator superfamily domain-containing protein n=1 Tax=Kickxella alabastrina TaxID=61397 RepID=UPI00221F3FCF